MTVFTDLKGIQEANAAVSCLDPMNGVGELEACFFPRMAKLTLWRWESSCKPRINAAASIGSLLDGILLDICSASRT